MAIVIPLILILICCLIIWKASDGFEAASEYLGRNLSEGVRGATINAIGSSMPELFTTLFFLLILRDKDGFAGGIGTTAGSALFNGMIIPAAVILVVMLKGVSKGVRVSPKVIFRDGLALLACEFVLIFLVGGSSLAWWHGLVLMGLYGIYVTYMLTSMKRNDDEEEEEDDDDEEDDDAKGFLYNLFTLDLEALFVKGKINNGNAWTLLLVAVGIIGGTSALLVHACENLGEALGIPVYFIAVILASAATSVPDTIISMKDAQKGNYDDAVSNALGSNIFDICFALGFPLFLFTLLFGTIHMSPETVEAVSELRILLFVLTFLAFLIFAIGRTMGRFKAVLLILIYVAFCAYVMGRAYDAPFTTDIALLLESVNAKINALRFWN